MQLTRPLRLPLATGASPANLALGIGIIGFVGAAPVYFGSILPEWVAFPCGILIAVWFFAIVGLPFVARKRRASDVVLGAAGVDVVSGPFGGRRIDWSALSADRPVLRSRAAGDGDAALRLPGGIVVNSTEPEEVASLADLATTLDALARSADAKPAPAPTGLSADVATCADCGAPLTPGLEATSRCAYCGADAPLPDELRREVAHLVDLTRSHDKTARALERLERWPRAPTVNAVLALAAAPLVLGWPAGAVFTSEYFQYHDVLSWRDVFVLFASTAAVTVGLVFVVARQTAHRRAYALVVAGFAAVRLDVEGEHFGCRRCGAPLPILAEAVIVPCAYCRAENVMLGLELPPRVAAEAEQAASLGAVVAERTRSLRVWRVLSLVAAALIAGGGVLLREPVARAFGSGAPRHAPVDRPWSYDGPPRPRR